MSYEKIVLLGTGQLFLDCLAYVKELAVPYVGYDMSVVPRKMTQVQAENKGLAYVRKEKEEVYAELRDTKEKTLLLSVINPSIVPGYVLSNEQILAINCHQAILPSYKGRNAEAWAIYEGETVTGVTWHKMLSAVDAGEILLTREIPITEEATAYSLFREQLKCAYETFTEFMPEVLKGNETFYPQPEGVSRFHYEREVPADGYLDLTWDGEKISRFLRATDYGILAVMPRPVIRLSDGEYIFKFYKIEKTADQKSDIIRNEEGDTLIILKPGYQFTFRKCQKKEKKGEK